jgi:serine/threonine protein kinase
MELIGSRFGHIRIVDILGQGGMGDVYAGYDETLQRRVALKAIRPEQRLDAEARSRLIREARTLSQLEHPNICRIYEYIEGDEVDLLVLELIEGKTLEQALRDGLQFPERLRIADAIARVLVAAHRAGIIHRDLKPENVMLTPAGEVKVLDFGLARWAEKAAQSGGSEPVLAPAAQLLHIAEKPMESWFALEESSATLVVPNIVMPTPEKKRDRGLLTAAGVTMGTPLYMSPEQARGETLTPASDMYSLGLVMQTLFTGREPYEPTMTGREVMLAASKGESLPVIGARSDITALIERLKQLAPTDRPTAVETLDRLRRIADKPKRLIRQFIAAVAITIVVLSVWKYVTDLRRERAAAVAAETEARARRAQAEKLIGFMVNDLRTKLEPVGRLEILNDVADKTLEYVRALDQAHVGAPELAQNAKALNQLGEVRIAQGNVTAAMTIFTQALRLAQTAVARDPKNEEAQLAVGTSHFWIGNAYRLQGDVPRAVANMQAYLACAEKLSAMSPRNEQYRLECANGHSVVGAMLEARSDLNGALSHYQTSLTMRQAYVANHPASHDAQADLARAINKIGVVATKLGDLHKARDQFELEASLYRALLAAEPRQNQWKKRLASSYGFLSWTLDDLGQLDEALETSRKELAFEDELCKLDPANVQWNRDRAVTHSRIGAILRAQRKLPGALAELEESEKALVVLATHDRSRPDLKRDLAAVQIAGARALVLSGRVAEARTKIDAAIATLTTIEPADQATSSSLGDAYGAFAEVLERSGAQEDAAAARRKAVAFARPPAGTTEPGTLARWARSLIDAGRVAEARPIVARLNSIGYRNADLQAVCEKHGC